MTPLEFANNVRYATRTNATTFPDTELLAYMNTKRIELAKAIEGVNEYIFGVIETRDLVASSVSRQYMLPADWLQRFSRVEAKLNGIDWVVLRELDLNTYERSTDETSIVSQFSNEQNHGYYDIFGEALWLYTGTIEATVTDGLKLWSYAYPTKITDLTEVVVDLGRPSSPTAVGMPVLMHELWQDAVSITWKSNQDRPIALNERELAYSKRLGEVLANLRTATRDRSDSQSDFNDGSDDGYDY